MDATDGNNVYSKYREKRVEESGLHGCW